MPDRLLPPLSIGSPAAAPSPSTTSGLASGASLGRQRGAAAAASPHGICFPQDPLPASHEPTATSRSSSPGEAQVVTRQRSLSLRRLWKKADADVPSVPRPPVERVTLMPLRYDEASSSLRPSISRSRLSPYSSTSPSAATSPNGSSSDLLSCLSANNSRSGLSSPAPSSPAGSRKASHEDVNVSPRRGTSESISAVQVNTPTTLPAARPKNRLRSLSLSRKKSNTDLPRQSLDKGAVSQASSTSNANKATVNSTTFPPSAKAPPVPVRSQAYMQFSSTSPQPVKEAQDANKTLKLPHSGLVQPLSFNSESAPLPSQSSALSSASSHSSSSLTSRSSSLSTAASSYPVSPSTSAVDQSQVLPTRKAAVPPLPPLRIVAQPTQAPPSATTSSSTQAVKRTPKESKDSPSTSPTATIHSLAAESRKSLSFRSNLRRKVFGRPAAAPEPPTPELVGDSSADSSRDDDSTSMTPPTRSSIGLAPFLTDSGKLDFFGSIEHLPSEDGHSNKVLPPPAALGLFNAADKKSDSALHVANSTRIAPSRSMPVATGLAPSPVLTSPTEAVPSRSASVQVQQSKSHDGSASATSTHRRATPSDGSLDIGTELMMAVLSVQSSQAAEGDPCRPERSATLDTYASSFGGRPSMSHTLRTLPTASLSASPESINSPLPPIANSGQSLRYSPPRSSINLPSSYSTFYRSASGSSTASRRFLTEAQMRDMEKQAALYAERARKERRPAYVHRPGLFASAVKDDEDSEDDYGADEEEEEGQSSVQSTAKSKATEKATKPQQQGHRLQVKSDDVEPVSPTSGAVLFPSTFAQNRAKRTDASGKGSAWNASSDEDEDDSKRVRRVVTPEPGLDVPAKRALYTCTLLKIHPHLAPHFLVPNNPTAQPLAAAALAAKDGLSAGGDQPANPLATEVRFPRSTNAASFLANHSSTTSLARGGLRIALARAQVMRTLKRRKLPIAEEVEISWFQRKYGSELVAPDRIMAEMGRRPPVSPEALMKAPVASEHAAAQSVNPMAAWARRPRFADRVQDWRVVDSGRETSIEPQSVLAHLPSPVHHPSEARRVPKPPVLLLSPRVCALAGVAQPSWKPPAVAPKRFRTRENGGTLRAGPGLRRVASATSTTASSGPAPWLAPRLPSVTSKSAPTSPKVDTAAEDAERAATLKREQAIAQSQEAIKAAAAKAAADAMLVRQLKQALPGALTQNVIAEEETLVDSDEEDLPLSLLQASRRDQQRRTQDAQLRQREGERRREDANRRALERNKAMLAEARERRAKGDQRQSVLRAHDYGAGNAISALGPSESRKEIKEREGSGSRRASMALSDSGQPVSSVHSIRASASAHGHDQGRSNHRTSTADKAYGLDPSDRRQERVSVSHDGLPSRASSAVNLRASYIELAGATSADRRLSRVHSSTSLHAHLASPSHLLSPPAPASIRHRSPDRSSTMPAAGDFGRGMSMNSISQHQQLLSTPPSWAASPSARASTLHAGPLPLATPPSPYGDVSPSQSHASLHPHPQRMSSAASAKGAHERMSMAIARSDTTHGAGLSPGGLGPPAGAYPFSTSGMAVSPSMYAVQGMHQMQQYQHPMSMYGGNMQAFQMQQAAAAAVMAAQQQQQFQAISRPGSFMQPPHMVMGMPLGSQPLVTLDARTLPASATVLRRQDTIR